MAIAENQSIVYFLISIPNAKPSVIDWSRYSLVCHLRLAAQIVISLHNFDSTTSLILEKMLPVYLLSFNQETLRNEVFISKLPYLRIYFPLIYTWVPGRFERWPSTRKKANETLSEFGHRLTLSLAAWSIDPAQGHASTPFTSTMAVMGHTMPTTS
ncbi:hypothetical protein TMatcc_007462 [Talaromyces marneffei ATCC 18224]